MKQRQVGHHEFHLLGVVRLPHRPGLGVEQGYVGLRGATQPFAESLAEANARIAALSTGGVGARQRQLHQRLTRPPDPHRGWTLAALAGLLIWVGGALLLFYRGLRPDARLVPARFWPLAGVVCAGLALFCLGLARA